MQATKDHANGNGSAQLAKLTPGDTLTRSDGAKFSVLAPTPVREILDVVHQSMTALPQIVRCVTDAAKGVEMEIRANETFQLIEERERRTSTVQREIIVRKDR